jgi:hypothetical protein
VTSKALKPVMSFQPQNTWDVIHYKKFPFTELQGKLRVLQGLPGIPGMNQTHPVQTSYLILLIWTNLHISMGQHSHYGD